jgi:hypothetical protein
MLAFINSDQAGERLPDGADTTLIILGRRSVS